ncbi:MAG: hypothetical protein JXA11_06660 [Phycisphaerae bacterium]|nr:hypothetical protein [Phycisphaerae bacterium]
MIQDADRIDPPREDAETTDQQDRRKSLLLLILLLLLLLIVATVTYVSLKWRDEKDESTEPRDQTVTQPAGERFEFSAFYHADDGTWIIRDEGILVLKERKFISASEKDAYTIHEVKPGEKVIIIQADQRWKRVLVQPDGLRKPVLTGWIDANNVRNADRIEETQPTTAPESHKAMKQKFPH